MDFEYKNILDILSDGILVLSSKLEIVYLNKRAKDIIGVRNKYEISHNEGCIEYGDVVLIGDTSFGDDDGGLESSDLIKLGLKEKVDKGDYFIYIGQYELGGSFISGRISSASYRLEEVIDGNKTSVTIDYGKRSVIIEVNGYKYVYEFLKSVGHMVVLDKNFNLKFYQGKGYTIRGETIKELLNGGRFFKKDKHGYTEIDVIGKNIKVVFKEGSINDYILKLSSKQNKIENIYEEINKRPVKYSLYNLDDNIIIKIEDISEINRLLRDRIELVERLNKFNYLDVKDFFFGNTEKMRQIEEYVEKISDKDSSVLILGESGTGKSTLANLIHKRSGRSGRYVEINCGAIPESLLESELFGYVKGAFTGANVQGKRGLIEYADGGTVFFDEISELPIRLQVKLLDVIQNKRVKPVGSNDYKNINVRFIFATNRDLFELVKNNRFREDLYYRINVFPIEIPPLRERKEDLYDLIYLSINRICQRYGYYIKKISNAAYYKLYNYDFPGNIRELENILERAINLSKNETIESEDIVLGFSNDISTKTLKEIIETTEKNAIIDALRRNNGDKKKAMEELGIKKSAFYEKIKKYAIE
ncbi:MAG: sigma 54-interacting transcriptional regulator [Caloramator sp.]|nr:sigma 54-interacting transcriptional regulator [Caloramator sp.]